MNGCALEGVDLSNRYEELRRGALGEVMEPENRRGLTLLLRRGLSAWARAVVVDRAPEVPGKEPSQLHDAGFSLALRPELARLIAGMALAAAPAARRSR